MDGNKDEALRCVCIAEEAISAGNKERALKFIKLAQRLNHSVKVDELLAACENLNSGHVSSKSGVDEKRGENKSKDGAINSGEELNRERSYTQEHVQLIKQITRNKDYYGVLGVEKTCSVEEIKRAYRKLSLKVHPDKNKAPGSEEAFKKVCKAFKCLSDDGSRRQYDQTGLVEEYEHSQQYNVRQRRRRTEHDLFEDNFDPNEIFRAFFGQGEVFRTSHVYRGGGMDSQSRGDFQGGRPNFFILLQILPFLLIFLLAYLPFSEPEYSLHKHESYTILLTTEKHGVEFYVKSLAFDEKYPPGSGARAEMENIVMKDYRNMLWRYCHIELQRRQWNRNLPTPHCDKLQKLEVS